MSNNCNVLELHKKGKARNGPASLQNSVDCMAPNRHQHVCIFRFCRETRNRQRVGVLFHEEVSFHTGSGAYMSIKHYS